jgi:hypothetical protein
MLTAAPFKQHSFQYNMRTGDVIGSIWNLPELDKKKKAI